MEKGEEGKEKNQKTILVIDDDPVFSKVLVEMGEDKNFRCLLAEDGEAGIKMAFEYRPDGIILDIGLPKVDGFKVLDKLKESSRTAQIPIHIISGFDRDNSKIKAEDNVGYIKKPVTLGNLNEIFEGFKKQRIGQIRSFLVVDNKPKQVNSILNILKQKGIDVIATDSFEGAYEILKNKPYDGIVLDYEANNEPAIELLEKLKELQEAPKYIIALIKDEMSPEEIAKIQNYTGNIIVKGPRLKERLLDETSLFLHYVSEGIDADRVYRKENISNEEQLFKGKKVLIVDDDMRNVFAVHSILESKGFEIRIGRNGREGIEQFLNNSDIELILLDIMMPEKDGYEVMKEIRNLPNGKNIPIIILTAKAMREERKKCIEAGANDYLTKPLDAEKLLSLLRVWLS